MEGHQVCKPIKKTKMNDVSLHSLINSLHHDSFFYTTIKELLFYLKYIFSVFILDIFFQVRALYDFTGEPGTAELSITAGEVLTVMRDNVGDGWCEGFNQNGKSGLFPAAYVQIVETTASAPSILIALLYVKNYINLKDCYILIFLIN